MTLLDKIERAGNRLPHPASLFAIGLLIVMLISQVAASLEWTVNSPYTDKLETRSLLSSTGLWWLLSHMVENFIRFPPLAIVLVGMLGIGMAERTGLLPALLRYLMLITPRQLLTPVTLFLGIMSSLGLDAGYVVLPPIAAAMYLAAGRSPLTGIATVFAGVSAGFSANLLITAVDPLLAGFTQAAATIIRPDYQVAVTSNWWFMIASTVILMFAGWFVTAKWVEPAADSYVITEPAEEQAYIDREREKRGLLHALLAILIVFGLIIAAILVPGGPLFGEGKRFDRWIEVTVPILFLMFFIPGVVFGISSGTIKNDRDAARIMGQTFAGLGPYIVLAFFAAQFIEAFKYSGLGEMLAISGGQYLASLNIISPALLTGFILLAMTTNLFIGSASAKYAFLAPVFVPMLMQVGFSPELTQAAYRVGDSVTNIITPLNPYMVIILAQVQKYARGSGMGTLIAMMLPYALCFALVWTLLLTAWMLLDIPLGPGAPLNFDLSLL